MNRRCIRSAFTLVEMLAVLALIGLLTALALPAFTNLSGDMNLTRAGQMVNDQLISSRQIAVTLNTVLEVRFIQDSSDPTRFTGIQMWRFDPHGENPKPHRKIEWLPEPIVIALENSPALSQASSQGTMTTRARGTVSYKAIRFRANGRVDSSLSLVDSYLTLQSRNASSTPPNNYYTVQLNPLTGRVSSYRP